MSQTTDKMDELKKKNKTKDQPSLISVVVLSKKLGVSHANETEVATPDYLAHAY